MTGSLARAAINRLGPALAYYVMRTVGAGYGRELKQLQQHRLSPLGRALLAAVVGVGLLGGLLAMHTLVGASSEADGTAELGSRLDREPLAAMVTTLTSAPADLAPGGSDPGMGLDPAACAVVAVCLIVLTATSVAAVAGAPATFHRLLDRGAARLRAVSREGLVGFPPSLTFLSVSRI